MISFQSIRVLGFGGSVILGYWARFARGGVAWPACPQGGGAGGLATASARASKRQLVFCNHSAIFESKSLADRPCPWAVSEPSESSPLWRRRHIRDQSAGEAFEQFGDKAAFAEAAELVQMALALGIPK